MRRRLARRLRNSRTLAGLLGRVAAGYLRLCNRTTRWEREGFDAFADTARDGPVILVLWHSRLLMAATHMEPVVRVTTLHDSSPAGRLAGAMQVRFGMDPFAMSSKQSNQAASREVLRRLRHGVPVGLTGDGPLGPARELKSAPLDWARVSGARVFLYAFSCTRQRRLDTWDRMLLPRPFGLGAAVVAPWDRELPRRADAETLEALRRDLEAALDAHQAAVDRRLGLEPGP